MKTVENGLLRLWLCEVAKRYDVDNNYDDNDDDDDDNNDAQDHDDHGDFIFSVFILGWILLLPTREKKKRIAPNKSNLSTGDSSKPIHTAREQTLLIFTLIRP